MSLPVGVHFKYVKDRYLVLLSSLVAILVRKRQVRIGMALLSLLRIRPDGLSASGSRPADSSLLYLAHTYAVHTPTDGLHRQTTRRHQSAIRISQISAVPVQSLQCAVPDRPPAATGRTAGGGSNQHRPTGAATTSSVNNRSVNTCSANNRTRRLPAPAAIETETSEKGRGSDLDFINSLGLHKKQPLQLISTFNQCEL